MCESLDLHMAVNSICYTLNTAAICINMIVPSLELEITDHVRRTFSGSAPQNGCIFPEGSRFCISELLNYLITVYFARGTAF